MLQAAVNHQGTFTNISAGWPGSTQNACVFWNFTLPAMVESGYFAPGVPELQLGKVMVPPILTEDPTCPLLPWLMCPTLASSTPNQAHFNRFLG